MESILGSMMTNKRVLPIAKKTKSKVVTLYLEDANADFHFLKWFREMNMEGQITLTDYAKSYYPGDYTGCRALERAINKVQPWES